jgi:DMSO reductase anchor subunit
MHPAPSIILFTVLSGLGFGLMAWLGIDPAIQGGPFPYLRAAFAVALVSTGLLASLFHLGRPARAIKSFSQWRTSWLSREAVASVATLSAFALMAAVWLAGLPPGPLGWIVAALALATVYCTAMIYAQMKSVPRWRTPLTPAIFLLAALAGGTLLAGSQQGSIWLLPALGLAQIADWFTGDRRLAASGSTLASATGLGNLGRLRQLEPPHTGQNYLLREMVFVIGRRHARVLRVIAIVLASILPLAILALLPAVSVRFALAFAFHLAGMITLRWLFFAQAEHVVGLYYSKR